MNHRFLRNILIFFLCFAAGISTTFAKENQDSSKINAEALINGLQDGALLVRLKTADNVIKGLEQRGRIKQANEVREKQLKENKEIYNAFKEKYNFGKVYFFYSTHTENVKNNELEGIFLDSSLNADSSINIGHSNFYIAEIGDIQSEAMSNTIRGLRIMDADFNEIDVKKHFYLKSVWQVDLLKIKIRTPADMVQVFNSRLHYAKERL